MAKKKPHDPAQAYAKAQERKDRDAEIQRLIATGANITVDRAGRLVSARSRSYQSNVANLFLRRETISQNHHNAFTTLAKFWAMWKGLDGGPEVLPGVQCGGPCGELVTGRMIKGGDKVKEALDSLDPQARAIMEAFMVATVEEDRPMAWRGVMERLGVTIRDRQTEAAWKAFDQLRAHYEEPRRVAA